MNMDLLNKTYDLVDEIKDLDVYIKLLELHKEMTTSTEIIGLIEMFTKANIKYDEASKYGKHHPDLKQTQLSLQEAKENLYNNDIIKEYKKCEKEIQKILNHISKEIANTVSHKIKHPNELGLVNKH